MNHIYRLLWNKSLGMFVAVSEFARSRGKSAGGKSLSHNEKSISKKEGRSTLNSMTRLAFAIASMVSQSAFSHTNALGWTINPDTNNAGNFIIDVYYGSWHAGGVSAEGSLDLWSTTNSFTQTSPFVMLPNYTNVANGTLPPGLVLGVNYFFPSSTGLGTVDTLGYGVYAFQSASFSNLQAGSYNFGFHPGALSSNWTPSQPSINAGAFTVQSNGSIAVVGAGPTTDNVDVHAPFHLSSGLGSTVNPVFEGGVLKVDSTGTTFAQAFTIDDSVSGVSSAIDQNSNASTFSGVFSNAVAKTGSLTISNSGSGGSVTLSGINTYTGATTIGNGATLALTGSGRIATSSGVANSGTFDIAGTTSGATIATLSGTGAVALGNRTLTLSNAANTFGGVIGGAGGVTIAGGTETLTGSNTYTGATTIGNGATLQVASSANLGAAGNGVNLNGGTLHTTGSFTSARNMTLAGNARISTDDGTTLTATGTISGAGSLYKEGTGTLILGGDNINWTGGTTIDAGLVKVTSATGIGTGYILLNSGTIEATVTLTTGQTIAVAGNTVIHTDAGTTTTLTGDIISQNSASNACFTKSGTGTLNLMGNAALNNGACVEQGTLRVNGIFKGNFVAVDRGATLRGGGLINAPIRVSGMLAPGNSPATLTANATVTMLSGSTFQADINGLGTGTGPGNYSRLLVVGAGHQFIAGGATLVPNLVNITGDVSYTPYVPVLGDGFRIVTAEGGIVGRFAPLIQPAGLSDGTRLAVFYNGDGRNGIDLRLVPTSYASYVQRSGANRNAQAAGNAIDNILNADQAGAATPTQERLAYALSSLTAQRVADAATLLSGEVHATLAAVAPLAGQSLQGTVAHHLNGGQGLAPDAAETASNSALWADLAGNRARWSGDATASGFTANRMQLTIGVDPLHTETTRMGAGISHSNANISATAGSGSVDETLVFAYAEHALQHMVFDGMAGYGGSVWKSQRGDPMGIAGSLNESVRGKSALLSAGVHATSDSNGMQPFARVLWQRTTRNGYNEGSASPAALTLLDYLATGTRVMAGLSGSYAVGEPTVVSHALQYSVALGRDSGDLLRPTVHAMLAGADMNILTPQVGRTFVQANLNGTSHIGKQTYAHYGVSGEIRSGRADLGISGGVGVSF